MIIGLTGVVLLLLFMLLLGALIPVVRHLSTFGFGPCDYDSCTQQISNWQLNGTSCFDDIPSCQDFLKKWRECQTLKNESGIC